ncbi:hypothetical protein NMG60_11018959 [Bertholletia excelsa]
MQFEGQGTLPRSSSCRSTKGIIPWNYPPSFSSPLDLDWVDTSDKPLVRKFSPASAFLRLSKTRTALSAHLRSVFTIISIPSVITTCRWLIPTHFSITPSLGRKVTGTLFGNRRGHVSFAVQNDPRCQPFFLVEFAVSISALVREMSTGLVRIALECEKGPPGSRRPVAKLISERSWTMYCNGKRFGHAPSRTCSESDWHVLSTVQRMSVGAGVIPAVGDGQKGSRSEGEWVYMRARFERVVGSHDSEAFYMMNPDDNGGPELSIFLLRI